MSESISTRNHLAEVGGQENAPALRKKQLTNQSIKVNDGSSTITEDAERPVLTSKSSNGMKVNSSNTFSSKLSTKKPLNTSIFGNSSGTANKARKVISKPFSIFEPTRAFETSNAEGSFGLHDSTTLQRSTSQIQNLKSSKSLSKSTTLSGGLFSSSFNTSFGDMNSNNKTARKIKSQLTMTAGDSMAEFFKRSKVEEQEKLGINQPKHDDSSRDNEDNQGLIEEVTFADDSHDITSMKKVLTERNSPMYERTHKISVQNLLSSSTESDEFGETTFEFKGNNNSDDNVKDLEELLFSRSRSTKNTKEDLDIEFTSHKPSNARYDESIPDVVLEGIHRAIPDKLLNNLWSESKSNEDLNIEFEDPLNLTPVWNTEAENNTEDVLALKPTDMASIDGFKLEFSDIDEESEGEDELLKLQSFYEKRD